jgi:hypothetical protein
MLQVRGTSIVKEARRRYFHHRPHYQSLDALDTIDFMFKCQIPGSCDTPSDSLFQLEIDDCLQVGLLEDEARNLLVGSSSP